MQCIVTKINFTTYQTVCDIFNIYIYIYIGRERERERERERDKFHLKAGRFSGILYIYTFA